MKKQKIKVDIVSDINCPWCFLGEHRFQKAVTEVADTYEFDVTFKPYELSPNAPQEGEPKEEYFIRNYGPAALSRLEGSSHQLSAAGEAEGVIFDFEKADRVHNTFNGHRLIWLAEQYGVQQEVALALFRSNFTEGQNVNDPAVLTQIGVENGIPAERLANFFSSDEGKEEVKALEQKVQRAGISGVPAFIFNDKYLVSGAQPAETFVKVFKQVAPAPALEEIKMEEASCGLNGRAC